MYSLLVYSSLIRYLYRDSDKANFDLASRPAVRCLKERLVKFQCSARSMVQEFLGPVIARTKCIIHKYHYDAIKR